ncbi:MAG: hypothetical protein PHG35_01905 [Dehalococcoidales bacterium]|nr:hypothetical protein [Dehalococcoidales bacterium]
MSTDEALLQRALKEMNELEDKYPTFPDRKIPFEIVNGKVGQWRMLPNGQTVFYCPHYILSDWTRINTDE